MASNDRAYSRETGPIAAVAVISVDAFERSTNPSRGEKRLAGPVELTAPPSFGRRFGCVARYRSARRKRWRNSGLARHTSPRAPTPFAYGRLELTKRKNFLMTHLSSSEFMSHQQWQLFAGTPFRVFRIYPHTFSLVLILFSL